MTSSCGEKTVHSPQIMRRKKQYIYELPKWPEFHWDNDKIIQPLATVRHNQGKLLGRMEALGFNLQKEATLQALTTEVIKSSEIEGEILDQQQVRSSIARKLGIKMAGLVHSDRHIDGVVEMALDATQNYKKPLSEERLFGWRAALFPTGRSGMHKIVVAQWRNNDENDPMQVVSGAMGKEIVHFQAPGSDILASEMQQFFEWFNNNFSVDPIIKAAVAHLW